VIVEEEAVPPSTSTSPSSGAGVFFSLMDHLIARDDRMTEAGLRACKQSMREEGRVAQSLDDILNFRARPGRHREMREAARAGQADCKARGR
jgi:hypothetical protein